MGTAIPDPHLLNSIRVGQTSLRALMGEAFDNSFDAGASNVIAQIDGDGIVFEDDGRGVELDTLDFLVKLGGHLRSHTTSLGTWGIGIKTHAIRWGHVFEVETAVDTRDGHPAEPARYLLRVRWPDIQRRQWHYDDPKRLPRLVGSKTSTRIRIGELHRNRGMTAGDIRKAVAEMALVFQPALVSGRTITINGQPVTAPAEPDLTDIIEKRLELNGGTKAATVRAGLLVDTARAGKLYLVHVSFGHRVIMPESTFGCYDYPARGLFARVHLEGNWTLAKYKDDLPDHDREELEARVHALLKPLLEKCEQDVQSARIEEAQDWLNINMPENLRVRPRHKREKKPVAPASPPSPPAEKGKQIKEGDASPTGPTQQHRKRANGIQITIEKNMAALHGIGKFHPGKGLTPHKMMLAADDPTVALHLGAENKEYGWLNLRCLTLTFYEDWKNPGRPRQTEMFAPPDDDDEFEFGKRLAKLFSLGVTREPGKAEAS